MPSRFVSGSAKLRVCPTTSTGFPQKILQGFLSAFITGSWGLRGLYNQKILLPDSATVAQAAALSAGLRGSTGGTETRPYLAEPSWLDAFSLHPKP